MCFPTEQTLEQFHRSEAPNLIFLYFLTWLSPLAVAQHPLFTVQKDSSCLLNDCILRGPYIWGSGTQACLLSFLVPVPCWLAHTPCIYFSAGQTQLRGWTQAFGARRRHQSAVTGGEAQAVTTCGLLTSSLNAATTHGSFPRLKPLQTFLARIFCEKWYCQRTARTMCQLRNFPCLVPLNCLTTSHLFPFTIRIAVIFYFFHFCVVCFSVHGSIVAIVFSL